uniref:Uncharacterized protein n=1 Tax=Ditylenchus dipsaci TaxID=166011 RepID=A0A915D0U9_9BILA
MEPRVTHRLLAFAVFSAFDKYKEVKSHGWSATACVIDNGTVDEACRQQPANYFVKYPVRHGNRRRLGFDGKRSLLFIDRTRHLTRQRIENTLPKSCSSLLMCLVSNIAVQAVLALAASWQSRELHERSLTGLVIDSGDWVTHCIRC